MLTAVPFTVPFTSTVNVSGGGAALQTAVAAAGPGTRIVVTDSLSYSQVTVSSKTNLTIEAAAGQTPAIVATAGPNNFCVGIGGSNSGIRVKGFRLIGNGNENALAQLSNGLVLGTAALGTGAFDRLIVEDCEFTDLNPAAGVPGVSLVGTDGTLNDNVQIIRCTFTDMSTPAVANAYGYGAITVSGYNRVYIQNCLVRRVSVARAASNMRGVVVKNLSTVVEDVLCSDLGTASSNEAFKHTDEAGFGTAVGTSSFRNCIAYNCKRFYRITLGGATMNVTNCVGDNDVAGIAAGQILVQQTAGTLNITDSVLTGAGDGTTFTAAITENHNDVFNFLATGKVLDATDITVDPLYEDVPNGDWVATEATCQTAASDGGPVGIRYPGGEKIIYCNH